MRYVLRNQRSGEISAKACQKEGVLSPCPKFVSSQPVLAGLFGVSKHEWDGDHEVLRLIMDLRPLNSLCLPIAGDTAMLPLVSQLTQLELVIDDNLVISPENLKSMFYCFEVDPAWYSLLAFNKPFVASIFLPCRRSPSPHVTLEGVADGFFSTLLPPRSICIETSYTKRQPKRV